MPPPIDASIKRKVIQEWLSGIPRSKIAIDNNIGEGTVSGIVSEFKIGLDNGEFDSSRELALAAKKQGLNLSDLAAHARLYNYFIKSGATEEDIESFIVNISNSNLPPEKVIQYVNRLFNISNTESIPLDQVSEYIKEKLQEKQKIDEAIKEANAMLQSKTVSIEAINEHILLKEELKKYRLSTKDIRRLLDLLEAAKEYRYSPGKIVAKLRSIKRLENKENKLKNNCEALSKQVDKYKEIIPLAQLIYDLHIDRSELISFKVAVNEAAETYGISSSAAALRVINVILDYNKKGQLEHELCELNLQKYAINEFCSSHSPVIIALMKLKSRGMSEERILHVNNILENNGYKDNEIYSWLN